MTEGAPQVPATEFVIPFVPDTKPVEEFLDRVEERVGRIADRLSGLELPDERGAARFPVAEPEMRADMPTREPLQPDTTAEEPRSRSFSESDQDTSALQRAIQENTSSIDELRDDIESLSSSIAALVEAIGGGG